MKILDETWIKMFKIDEHGLIVDGDQLAGYIIDFAGHGAFGPNREALPLLTQDQIDKHNSILAQMELEATKKYDNGIFYLTREYIKNDPKKTYTEFVSNWIGTFKVPAYVKSSWHNFAGKDGRRDVWFSLDGERWHGVNIGDSQIVRAKRLKRQPCTKSPMKDI
jgi:hypothetical protein